MTIQVPDRPVRYRRVRGAYRLGIPTDDLPPSPDTPSYAALLRNCEAVREITAEQALMIENLIAEVAELRNRLAKTSRNSPKPPSTVGHAKPAPKSRRVRWEEAGQTTRRSGSPSRRSRDRCWGGLNRHSYLKIRPNYRSTADSDPVHYRV